MDAMDGLSMDIERTNLDNLRAVFPKCFAEGKLDIDKLLGLCGEYIENDFEKYRFEWKDKAECLRLAQKRSAGTLRPCPEDSVNWDTTQNLYIESDILRGRGVRMKSWTNLNSRSKSTTVLKGAKPTQGQLDAFVVIQ